MESKSLLGVVIFACLPLAQAGGDVDSQTLWAGILILRGAEAHRRILASRAAMARGHVLAYPRVARANAV